MSVNEIPTVQQEPWFNESEGLRICDFEGRMVSLVSLLNAALGAYFRVDGAAATGSIVWASGAPLLHDEDEGAYKVRGPKGRLLAAAVVNAPALIYVLRRGLPVPASFPLLEFDYVNWRGVCARRRVRPLRVEFGTTKGQDTPAWLLVAFDESRQAERSFVLERMVLVLES